MNRKLILVAVVGLLTLCFGPSASANPISQPYIRLADLEVDNARLAEFQNAAAEHIAVAKRTEPGILAFHVAAEKGQPNRIRVFEMYANDAAYREHLQTPHFQTFVAATQSMIISRKLFDVLPVRLGERGTIPPSPVVRIAELEIEPTALSAYVAAVAEEIDESIRVEPGVAAIYSVALKEAPTHLRFFEIYADDVAYRQHIASPHFRKYVDTTKEMIAARRLLETESANLYVRAR